MPVTGDTRCQAIRMPLLCLRGCTSCACVSWSCQLAPLGLFRQPAEPLAKCAPHLIAKACDPHKKQCDFGGTCNQWFGEMYSMYSRSQAGVMVYASHACHGLACFWKEGIRCMAMHHVSARHNKRVALLDSLCDGCSCSKKGLKAGGGHKQYTLQGAINIPVL